MNAGLPPGAAAAAVLAAACAVLAGGAGPAAAEGSLVTLIDNSHADSVVEIDRAANVQTGSGAAGSDLADGTGGLAGSAGTVLGLGRGALEGSALGGDG